MSNKNVETQSTDETRHLRQYEVKGERMNRSQSESERRIHGVYLTKIFTHTLGVL